MIKTQKLFKLILPAILLFLISCAEDEAEESLVLPSNLIVNTEIDNANKGLVRVTASADKVNFFTIIFTENGIVESKESTDGAETYIYDNSGEYNIVVRAHTTSEKFIENSTKVTIDLGTSGGGSAMGGYSTPLTYPNYTLVWNDEFNGTELSNADWNYEIGTGNNGWGNNELQYYRSENTTVANGVLKIEAKNQFFNGRSYTSSRLTTQNKQSFKYGRIDIRAKMPEGQGLWPALWMLGDQISTTGWPRCGEIDIMEMVGGTTTSDRGDAVTHGTAHWADGNGARALYGQSKKIANGKLSDEFHVYSIIWNSQKIEWYVDDEKFNTLDISGSELSEFRESFFFIINVAVGGDWPGSPDSSTSFPQSMEVDYLRVFQ